MSKATKAPTKKSLAAPIVKRMLSRKTPAARADILEELESKAGLTQAGAKRYYQNFTNGTWDF